eukprot:jgi/Psemu1/198195/e_gw1.215.72.1
MDNARALAATSFAPLAPAKTMPTLEEIVSIPTNYECPEGRTLFKDIVLPQNVTHANRKIPKVVHMTAKTRCVTGAIMKNIMKWKLPDHSLYLHDDTAVYKLIDYSVNDRYGNELIQNLTRAAMCITNGATLSDFWRYLVLYYHGGIYTDLDNAPGNNYTAELIQPDTDSFFFVESIGSMSQFYMASSKHHPILLQFLKTAVDSLHSATNNVMVNNPAQISGPAAVKIAMIKFRRAVNAESDGYETEGIYEGALEYPSPSQLLNRTVTIVGKKGGSNEKAYIIRNGLRRQEKKRAWSHMNMTHYHGSHKRFPKRNKISCQQHASRMVRLISTNTSFYYNKRGIADLVAKYEFGNTYTYPQGNTTRGNYYFDINTDEMIYPWKKRKKDDEKKEPDTRSKGDESQISDEGGTENTAKS